MDNEIEEIIASAIESDAKLTADLMRLKAADDQDIDAVIDRILEDQRKVSAELEKLRDKEK